MKPIKYQRKIIEVEKRLGFMYIPAKAQELMPNENTKVDVRFEGEDTSKRLSYNTEHNRIFGLTSWYKKQKIKVGDVLTVEATPNTIFISNPSAQSTQTEIDEAEDLIDLSGLTSIEKGDIVEDRIKELLVLYGQGLLNVYKPVVDKEGIDLIVTKSGTFKTIFIQVKSRFNAVENNKLVLTIKGQAPHYSYYVLGAAFNPATLELEDKILLIPSHDLEEKGTHLSNGKIRVTASLKENSKDLWQPYFILKKDLVNHLIEQFEEASKYLR